VIDLASRAKEICRNHHQYPYGGHAPNCSGCYLETRVLEALREVATRGAEIVGSIPDRYGAGRGSISRVETLHALRLEFGAKAIP